MNISIRSRTTCNHSTTLIVNQHYQKGKGNFASHVRSLRSVQESHESTSYLACIFPANRRKVLSLAPVTLLARSAPQPPAMVSR